GPIRRGRATNHEVRYLLCRLLVGTADVRPTLHLTGWQGYAEPRCGEGRAGQLEEAAEQVVPPPVLILERIHGRQVGDSAPRGDDLVGFREPQLDDRRLLHGQE